MKINRLALFFGSIIILFAACTKISSTDIGTGLIPAVDNVDTKDTIITVFAKNAGDSTISPTISQVHVVGNVNDPLFGTTEARINFQLALPSSRLYFENDKPNLYFDSVVLVLSYNGAWGDTMQSAKLRVNEIDNNQEFLPDTSVYDAYTGYLARYDNEEVFATTTSLTDVPTTVNPATLDDSIYVFKDSGINMIRIKLTDVFGKKLLYDFDSTNAYKNDSTFHKYLRGLQVYAEGTNNALLKIGLADANTRLALYYHYHPKDSAAAVMESTVKYFAVNATSAHSNYILRDRANAPISNYLPPNGNINKNDDEIFLQAGPGTYATISVDSNALLSLRSSNWIIHRAELLMQRIEYPTDNPYFYTAPNLFLLAKNDTGRFVIPGFDTSSIGTADAVFSSSYLANYADFGGVPKKNLSTNSLYSFNLSRYVQGVIKGNRLHPFVLYAPYNEPFQLNESVPYSASRGYVSSTPANTAGCGRVVLYGGDGDVNNTSRMRLHIVYSLPH